MRHPSSERTLLFVAVLIGAVAIPRASQESPATQQQRTERSDLLTNSDIVALVEARLDVDVIRAKIQTTPHQFDTSTSALIALKNKGVSDALIKEMVNRAAATPSTPPNVGAANAENGKDEEPLEFPEMTVNVESQGTHPWLYGSRPGMLTFGAKGIAFEAYKPTDARMRDPKQDRQFAWFEISMICADVGPMFSYVVFKDRKGRRLFRFHAAEAEGLMDDFRDFKDLGVRSLEKIVISKTCE